MMVAVQQEGTVMIKKPSFPAARAEPSSRRQQFDHRLSVVAVPLAIIVAAALLVRYMGPIPQTESDPDTYMVAASASADRLTRRGSSAAGSASGVAMPETA